MIEKGTASIVMVRDQQPAMNREKTIEVTLEEALGINRIREPVTAGIPLPRGFLHDTSHLSLIDNGNNPVPFQAEILSRWPDQSIKWVLIDFLADCLPNSSSTYYLQIGNSLLQKQDHQSDVIEIGDDRSTLTINTGKALFVLDKKTFMPFKSVKLSGVEMIDAHNSHVLLKDDMQDDFIPVIKDISLELRGLMRCTVRVNGHFESGDNKVFSDFFARMSFYAGKSIVKIDFTIRNPEAARHPGGLWDLGDDGSVYFKDLSFNFTLPEKKSISIFWKSKINDTEKQINGNRIEIYQDSSGGENWDSPNHVNRYGEITNSFRGYKVSTDTLIEEGLRATPSITITSGNKTIAAAIQKFWQNFPKSIGAENNTLTLKLFPDRYNDKFELQGGEQKTHTIYVQFETDANGRLNLDWAEEPLIARVAPEWYTETMAIGYMSPKKDDKNPDYQALVDNAISGESSFFSLREKIDEYGWRNFGDIFASHEAVAYKGGLSPFVSHYNNQYDIINGCILQFARTGDIRWYRLMKDLARHVIDIDIYHTQKDRPAYNGGHFWHTDHFMHAETSTHRSFSRKNAEASGMKSYGGGPSPEHCYTTGLASYYFLTGDVMAKEAVIELADWIMNIDKTEKSLLGILRKIKQMIYRSINKYSNAPGRGEANSINTLLDAFELTGNRKYLSRAEDIIKKFISPSDDIDKLNQQQIELRWFYLIFLQATGKYLDIKDGMKERDQMFDYARDSLLYHARWMLENEVPYKQMFHVVEIPSSTWPAHDVRKSAIFDYASKYGEGDIRNEFRAKAEYFYNAAIKDILSFDNESRTFVRPLAVLMNYGVMHTYFQNTPDEDEKT